jgi:hypothetical protein
MTSSRRSNHGHHVVDSDVGVVSGAASTGAVVEVVSDGVSLAVSLGVSVGVCVTVCVTVSVEAGALAVRVSVAVCVVVWVAVWVTVCVTVGLGVGSADSLGVGSADCVGVSLREGPAPGASASEELVASGRVGTVRLGRVVGTLMVGRDVGSVTEPPPPHAVSPRTRAKEMAIAGAGGRRIASSWTGRCRATSPGRDDLASPARVAQEGSSPG